MPSSHILTDVLLSASLSHTVPPVISALVKGAPQARFTVSCPTTQSPPTTIEWRREGLILPGSDSMTSELVGREQASYDNVLEVDGPPLSVLGLYSCRVSNLAGTDVNTVIFSGRLNICNTPSL